MATRKATSPTTKQLKTMLRRALNDGPVVPEKYVHDVGMMLAPDSNFSVARRIGLIQASQDGAFFKRVSADREMAVVVAGQFDAIRAAIDALREVADVMDRGLLRATLTLAKHRDMDAILAECKSHAVVGFGEHEEPKTGPRASLRLV